MITPSRLLHLATFGALLGPAFVNAQENEGPIDVNAHVYKPRAVEPTDTRVEELEAPDGFRIDRFASDLGHPRMLATGPDGAIYVARPRSGDVLLLRDTKGDGRADERRVVAEREHAHGVTVHDGRLFVATVHEVLAGDLQPDGSAFELEVLVEDLPDGGQHPNRTIGFGPDGMLYISVGSLSNAVSTPVTETTAAMLRARPDGSELTVFAEGLRNTVGFGWHPDTGEMWGMDHGIDWLGDEQPPEELNQIVEGAHYGWPYLWGDFHATAMAGPPPADVRERAKAPVLGYAAHSAPMQMVFYTGASFPEEYRGDAFIPMRGSWNRYPPSGYAIVRVRFEEGRPSAIEPFVTGFLRLDGDDDYVQFARLAGATVASDGALLVSDDENGVIYRVAYEGARETE